MNTIKSINLSLADWGVNKGKLVGSMELVNAFGEMKIAIDPTKAADIVRILAPALVATAQDVAKIMVASVEAQAALQAPIEAKAITATVPA